MEFWRLFRAALIAKLSGMIATETESSAFTKLRDAAPNSDYSDAEVMALFRDFFDAEPLMHQVTEAAELIGQHRPRLLIRIASEVSNG